jgi:PIN domain nuclease of toxin-antitoxin system
MISWLISRGGDAASARYPHSDLGTWPVRPVAGRGPCRDRGAGNTVLFRPISIWEIAIKLRLGWADFDVQPDGVAAAALASGFIELRLGWQAASLVATLPMHHRDPFDQILIAQALSESIPFYTADRKLAAYTQLVRVV